MGCVPSKKDNRRRSNSEIEPNTTITNESRTSKKLKITKKVIKSRFLRKLKNFESGLGVIYESPQESEVSVVFN